MGAVQGGCCLDGEAIRRERKVVEENERGMCEEQGNIFIKSDKMDLRCFCYVIGPK